MLQMRHMVRQEKTIKHKVNNYTTLRYHSHRITNIKEFRTRYKFLSPPCSHITNSMIMSHIIKNHAINFPYLSDHFFTTKHI